jgi:4-amino-4-deoxy-L-arabinose transferase-like glycosyltransferase
VFWWHTFPNPDEAYYWLWGQHPDWSYYDHPPFSAWVQGLVSRILGRSPFSLRLPNLLSNALLFYTYYRICRYLHGGNARRYFGQMVLLMLASPLYFLFLSLAWPDHWLIAFSLIAAYFFITFADGYLADQSTGSPSGQTWRLYSAAGALGVAGLCKYNAVFMVAGFAATLIADRRLHPLWRDRRLYIAGAIALLFTAPIVCWNISHQFQSFQYYVDRSVNTGGFSIKLSPGLNFLLFSVLMVSPVNVYAFGRYFQAYFKANPLTANSREETRSIYPTVACWTCILSSLGLTIIAFLSAGLYYWNITAYLLLFPLIPPLFSDRIKPSKLTKLFAAGQAYGLLFAVLLVIHYSVFPLSALVSRDADPDSRMLWGWEQVAAAVTAQAATLPDLPLIITTDYRSASALAYQLNQNHVLAVSDRRDQFDIWVADGYYPSYGLANQTAILLADDWHPFDPKFLAQFNHRSAPTIIPIQRFGHWIKNYSLIIGK